jgi:putative transcriptional regulator
MPRSTPPKRQRDGYLDGSLLVAMPSMGDARFARAVIYMCAHSADGAMGIIINQRAPNISFDESVCLTATIDILRDIAKGSGPDKALLALGYAGWAPGQLESEIQANGWLHCTADSELIFDPEVDRKYNRALGKIGIDPWRLVNDSGHA